MTKYRIIKAKHCEDLYYVQKRVLKFFWVNCFGNAEDYRYRLYECEQWINWEKTKEEIRKNNPKEIIIKEY